MMDKLTENDLIIPVLEFLKTHDGFATIGEIRDYIKSTYPLTPADLKMSRKRPAEHMFEQRIRNLTSHKKFEKLGLADGIDGGFRLRDGIIELINNSSDWLYARLASKSRSNVICKEIQDTDWKRRRIILDENVGEGFVVTTNNVSRRMRSSKLRQAAIEHFQREGKVECYCCGMSFEAVYGKDYPNSCIEIHHKKPLSMYEDEDLKLSIKQALKNVIPVCPNCHRVIHRHKLFSNAKINKLRKTMIGEKQDC